ncbi:hypothetical protein BOTBODRAFT_60107 [Botryobasidium botryosum FD-172 SS1]|uniref:Uncharacterized protein n=1 Tax=Botryobasidium botryosum (strain FD-172 SS1) TaxID=930990 RepID=A0A067LV96_BOTB1|nr:hypothetical protein BOTBODRAFT_60107 [Botryobasidium botryosum FD-172 SS1]
MSLLPEVFPELRERRMHYTPHHYGDHVRLASTPRVAMPHLLRKRTCNPPCITICAKKSSDFGNWS